MTYGEESIAQLLLCELAEKITLILILIRSGQQTINLVTINYLGSFLAVVSRSNIIGTHLQRLLQEDIELYLTVAQNIGVGRATLLILGKHIINHSSLILLRQVNKAEGYIQTFGHELGKDLIIVPGAVALERAGRIVPIAHKEAYNLMPLLLKQICRNG